MLNANSVEHGDGRDERGVLENMGYGTPKSMTSKSKATDGTAR